MGELLLYKITHIATGKRYFGVTSRTLKKRWRGHLDHALDMSRGGALQHAIRKYGAAAFRIELVTTAVDAREARAIERGLIAAHGTMVPGGYNMTSGGESEVGFHHSPETRAKLRAIGKARPPEERARLAQYTKVNVGRKHTSESRERMSRAQKGKPHPKIIGHPVSTEAREKMRQAMRRRIAAGTAPPPRLKGTYAHSPEARTKMSASAKTRWSKPVVKSDNLEVYYGDI